MWWLTRLLLDHQTIQKQNDWIWSIVFGLKVLSFHLTKITHVIFILEITIWTCLCFISQKNISFRFTTVEFLPAHLKNDVEWRIFINSKYRKWSFNKLFTDPVRESNPKPLRTAMPDRYHSYTTVFFRQCTCFDTFDYDIYHFIYSILLLCILFSTLKHLLNEFELLAS